MANKEPQDSDGSNLLEHPAVTPVITFLVGVAVAIVSTGLLQEWRGADVIMKLEAHPIELPAGPDKKGSQYSGFVQGTIANNGASEAKKIKLEFNGATEVALQMPSPLFDRPADGTVVIPNLNPAESVVFTAWWPKSHGFVSRPEIAASRAGGRIDMNWAEDREGELYSLLGWWIAGTILIALILVPLLLMKAEERVHRGWIEKMEEPLTRLGKIDERLQRATEQIGYNSEHEKDS